VIYLFQAELEFTYMFIITLHTEYAMLAASYETANSFFSCTDETGYHGMYYGFGPEDDNKDYITLN